MAGGLNIAHKEIRQKLTKQLKNWFLEDDGKVNYALMEQQIDAFRLLNQEAEIYGGQTATFLKLKMLSDTLISK